MQTFQARLRAKVHTLLCEIGHQTPSSLDPLAHVSLACNNYEQMVSAHAALSNLISQGALLHLGYLGFSEAFEVLEDVIIRCILCRSF